MVNRLPAASLAASRTTLDPLNVVVRQSPWLQRRPSCLRSWGKRHEDPKGAEGALLERRMQLHSRAELNPLRCTLLGICGAFSST